MSHWVLWIIAAGGLLIAEIFSLTLVLAMAAAGALAAAAAAGLGAGIAVQIAVFIAVTCATLVVVRPIARRSLRTPPESRTGVAALVGQSAQTVSQVDATGGQVKLAGEIWSARSWDGRQVIDAGTRVEVVKIEGATALVLKGD